ncbi:MAG: CNNM domain-containing protein, partial [Anaerovorax sp.]
MDATPDPSSGFTMEILFLIVLISVNAFFAASEMSFVSLNKNKVKTLAQEGNKRALLLVDLLEKPNKFLSTIQVAITLAGFLASASAATTMADDVSVYLEQLGVPYSYQLSVGALT